MLLDAVVARLVPLALVGEKRKINKSRARDTSRALVVLETKRKRKRKKTKTEKRVRLCEDEKKEKKRNKARDVSPALRR